MTKRSEHLRRAAVQHGPRLLAILFAVCGLCATGGALRYTVNTVQVTDTEGESRVVLTALQDPHAIVELADLTLNENDSAHYTHETSGANSGTLEVIRAFPVAVLADGQEAVAEVSTGTVADAVAEAGVELAPEDFTTPALDTPVTEQLSTVTVHRVVHEDAVTVEPIPFETQYIEETQDPDGAYTHHYLQQEGVEGTQQVTTRITYVDGEYTGTEVVDRLVITPAVDEVYLTVKNNVVSPLEAPEGITVVDGVPSSYSTVYTMRATGYYAARGRGASGLGLYYGTFAVDPTLIPYGTKVYITSTDGKFVYGWAIATDTGGFVQNNRMQVDLFYETYAESVANGVKEVYVYVP